MSNKLILGIIVMVVLAVGGIYLLSKNASYAPSYNYPKQKQNVQASPVPTQPPQAPISSPTSQGALLQFTVNTDDFSADLTTINVKKGDQVSITFNVKPNNVYHGGLDFRSDQISTGAISPGSSKTITFTATDSFKFTPYWPSSNVVKPYTISVVVQ